MNMITSIVTSLVALTSMATQQTSAERMVILATADQPIVTIGIVDASIKDVWAAWSTKEGICSWMVPSGTVDMRIGGLYRTSYSKGSDLKGPEVIENSILAYDPLRMISIKNTRVPADFPFKEAISRTWTVIYFKEIDAKHTEVTIRMNGYDASDDSSKLKAFFVHGNQASLDALIKRFAKK